MIGGDYPFVDSGDYRGLVADVYLGHRDREVALPLRLKWLYGVTIPVQTLASHSSSSSAGLPAPSHPADLVVVDATDRVVFDSTAAEYRVRDWGALRVHEWQTGSAVCRLLQFTESDLTYPAESTPDLVLDERTTEAWPPQVLSVKVNGQVLTGALEIVRGYNTAVTLSATTVAPGKRRTNRVFVAASPGGGDGLYPGCEEQPVVIRRINQVGPDPRGNFSLSSGACYWLNRGGPTRRVDDGYALDVNPLIANGLQVHNDCAPCCSCDDFVNTYRGIRKLYDKFKDLGERSKVVAEVYKANRERWLEAKTCREASPLRIELFPSAGGHVTVAVSLGNTTGTCLAQGRAEIHFVTSGTDPELVPNSTIWLPAVAGSYLTDGLHGGYPDFYSTWEPMDPGRSGKVRFVLKFNATAGDAITAVGTPYFNGVQAGDPVVTTRSLVL